MVTAMDCGVQPTLDNQIAIWFVLVNQPKGVAVAVHSVFTQHPFLNVNAKKSKS